MTKNGSNRNKTLIRCGKVLNNEVDLGEPTSFLDHVYLGCTRRQCEISKDIYDNYRTMFESRISAGGTEKLPYSENLRFSSWSHDMEGHAKKCVERCCELANRTTQQLYKVSTPCIDDHHFKDEETKSVGELSNVSSQIVQKCWYLARIGRRDILWSVNKLARSITKWTKASDKRLNRLISYIHHACEYKQYCYMGNTAKQCRLGRFQDFDFAGDLEDSKSTSGGTLCILGSHTFVPISWMCKKQTSVSHSSTESEIISLDAGLRLDGIPALDLWDLIISVLGSTTQTEPYRTVRHVVNKREVCSPPHTIHKRKQSHRVINDLDNVDFILSNVQSSHQEALLYVFEDNEAVIKRIIKGRSPTMRHVSRTHRIALDWLFDRINLDHKIQIKYIDTKNQLADILTKGSFTRDEWNHLLCLFNISQNSSTDCSEVMSKRTQKDSGEERVTAKSKPMMNLVSRCSEETPVALSSIASESPVKTRHESQSPLSPQIEQHHRTWRPVVDAYSSSYSEWNVDKTWSSQEWKSDELMDDRTGRPVVSSQHTDRFIIENDETNSYTEAESGMSLESRSFLNRENDQVRKRQNQSSKDATKDSDKHSVIWGMFMSSTLQASVFMWKNQKYRRSHNETDVRHI